MSSTANPQSPDIYRIIAQEATMAILVVKPDGHILYANQLAHDLFEFPFNADVAACQIAQLFPAEGSDRRIKTLSDDILELQGLIQEILVKKLNGQTFFAMLGIKHVEIDDEKLLLLMFHDVTFQKKLQREITEKQSVIHQAYQELIRQNKQLKELDLAKNRFIAMTTHELRTPLSAIVASAEILKLKLYDTPEQHDEFVAMIYTQGQHMLDLVNDILDFAKIQANRMDYFVEQRDLKMLAKSEVDGLLPMAESARVSMKFVEPTFDTQCYYDELRMRQIAANIINNAIKYNRPGGQVEVFFTESDAIVELHVKDTGPGIAESDQEKVFNEFETLGKVANHSKGTGLGMPISQRMIRAMGGDIFLKSTVGVGTEFWVTIPKGKILPEENYRSRPDSTDDLAA